MKIEHVAIWAKDIETARAFYVTYFGAVSNDRYVNAVKGFSSYFLSFEGGARLELMQRPDVLDRPMPPVIETTGYAHLAISVGSESKVDELTQRLKNDGVAILDGPRVTGDGYYESVILDPDGNRIEITV